MSYFAQFTTNLTHTHTQFRLICSDTKWSYLLTNIGPIVNAYWMMISGNLTSKYPTYFMCIKGSRINMHASNVGLGTFQHTECDVVSH